jgi:hypothetical protein
VPQICEQQFHVDVSGSRDPSLARRVRALVRVRTTGSALTFGSSLHYTILPHEGG